MTPRQLEMSLMRYRFWRYVGVVAMDPRDDEQREAGKKLAARVAELRATLPPRAKVKGHAKDCTCYECAHA